MNSRNWQGINIHHSASMIGDVKKIRGWHLQRGWNDIGYHFVITRKGGIEIGRPLSEIGAHNKGLNSTNIGICLVGKGNIEKFNQSQYTALVMLLRGLCDQFNISKDNISRHHEECPGINFNWTILEEV